MSYDNVPWNSDISNYINPHHTSKSLLIRHLLLAPRVPCKHSHHTMPPPSDDADFAQAFQELAKFVHPLLGPCVCFNLPLSYHTSGASGLRQQWRRSWPLSSVKSMTFWPAWTPTPLGNMRQQMIQSKTRRKEPSHESRSRHTINTPSRMHI